MFKDREEAGRKLTKILKQFRGRKDCVVLGIARGGVVVAAEVAKALKLPLNVIISRRLRASDNSDVTIGAVVENGTLYLDFPLMQKHKAHLYFLEEEVERERLLGCRQRAMYEKAVPFPSIQNKTVILIDEGIATEATIFASIQEMWVEKCSRIVVAIPVGSKSSICTLKKMVHEVFCLETEDVGDVSILYEDFSDVEDIDVFALLLKHRRFRVYFNSIRNFFNRLKRKISLHF